MRLMNRARIVWLSLCLVVIDADVRQFSRPGRLDGEQINDWRRQAGIIRCKIAMLRAMQ